MTLHTLSPHKGSFLFKAFSSISVGLIASSLLFSASARASVLVQPAILREEAVSPPAANPVRTESRRNIVGVASETAEFSTLVAAIEFANIGSVLSMEGPLTVFAPTDAAFALLPEGSLEALLLPDNRDLLVKLLYNHVAYGDLTSDKLATGTLDTFDSNVSIAFTPTGVVVDNATVMQADIDASNGVIHAVDQVLLPTGFVRALQARIEGSESAAAAATAAPARTILAPARPSAPTRTISAPAEPANAPTEEPSTATVDAEPVRALW